MRVLSVQQDQRGAATGGEPVLDAPSGLHSLWKRLVRYNRMLGFLLVEVFLGLGILIGKMEGSQVKLAQNKTQKC